MIDGMRWAHVTVHVPRETVSLTACGHPGRGRQPGPPWKVFARSSRPLGRSERLRGKDRARAGPLTRCATTGRASGGSRDGVFTACVRSCVPWQGEGWRGLSGTAGEVIGTRVSLVRTMTGGQHAVTALMRDADGGEYVVRHFPPGDPSVAGEIRVLERLDPLGALVPRLVGCSYDRTAGAVIVTSRVEGGPPGRGLSPIEMAPELAKMLARIHAIDGPGLRPVRSVRPDRGPTFLFTTTLGAGTRSGRARH